MVLASTFRKILFRCGVTPSLTGNIIPRDIVPQDGMDLLREEQTENIYDIHVEPLSSLSRYLDDTILYIAGYVARRLQRAMKCVQCALAITSSLPIPNDDSLLSIKDNGGLVMPSRSTERICKVCEVVFRSKSDWKNNTNFITAVMRKLLGMGLFNHLNEHHINTMNGIDSHVTSLIRLIINTYFTIRQHHKCKLRNIEIHNRRMRRSFTTILHSHYHA